jgi:translation elongation factor EF-Ts
LPALQLSAAPLAEGNSITEGCASLAGKVRENIALRRGWTVSSGPNGAAAL